jgi:hypothetical protein
MRMMSSFAALLLTAQASFAALPPRYQNAKDLDVMVGFIKSHERVLSTLKSIDFEHYVIVYQNDCKAVFARKHVDRSAGWVGPAEPLEFESATCGVE